jgi:hypothetical protein
MEPAAYVRWCLDERCLGNLSTYRQTVATVARPTATRFGVKENSTGYQQSGQSHCLTRHCQTHDIEYYGATAALRNIIAVFRPNRAAVQRSTNDHRQEEFPLLQNERGNFGARSPIAVNW